MPDSSARIDLPYLMPAQAQKHVTHNEALLRLDAVTQLSVEAFGAETPPATPAEGETHALGGAPTGVWAGQAGKLAYWDGTAWLFIAPGTGWRAWGRAAGDLRVWRDGGWQAAVSRTDLLGIGTEADAINALAVAGQASLFTHAGSGHQIKVNKAAAADTASLLFQTGWSGRAEMGTAGSDDFAVKVSADGSSWTEALRIPAASGVPSLPNGAEIDGTLTGTAVQASASDATAGRLLRTGAFGLGSATIPTLAGDSFNQPAVTGWARNMTAGTGGPRASVGQMLLSVRGYDASYFQMSALRSEDQLWFRRANTDGVPGPWRGLIHSGNLVGTLGVATDPRVIERGTNANGDYVRFADGTQICWQSLAMGSITTNGTGTRDDPYRSAAQIWTFPAAFATPPSVGGVVFNHDSSFGPRCAIVLHSYTSGASASSVGLFAVRHTGRTEADTITARPFATGRWFNP